MRKMLVVMIAALIGAPAIGLAQSPSFGIRVAGNAGTVGGKGTEDIGFAAGGSFGGFLEMPLTSALRFQPELLLTQKGMASTGISTVAKLNYIQVPLFLKVAPASRNVRPIFFVGPDLGLLLGASSAGISIKDAFKSTDLGFTAGGGVEIRRIALDLRYTHGLTSIAAGKGADLKSRSITFGLGYFIR
jgi:hypothetical protein